MDILETIAVWNDFDLFYSEVNLGNIGFYMKKKVKTMDITET